MTNSYTALLRNLFCALALLAASPALQAQDLRQVSLEDIWKKGTFIPKNVPGFNALSDGKRYTRLEDGVGGQEINIYDLAKGKKIKTLFRDSLRDEDHAITDYAFSGDEQKLLLFTKSEPIYRRSTLFQVWVYDLKTGARQLLDPDMVLHASFNPAGNKVAFVKGNNLYMKDLASGALTAVTSDGAKNAVINGNCDWVYEEEFSFSKAFEWSPDGNYIAYYRFDESKVKEFTIAYYERESNYPRNYTYKYPKAGEDNSVVSIHLYDVRKGTAQTADVGAVTDQYIPRIRWTRKPTELCIYRFNRLQNKLELLLADAATGSSKTIYTEENQYYIDINDNLTFLPDGESFILNSERDGYNHLYKWNWVKQQLTQLTSGGWDVDIMHGVDEKAKAVYYTAGVTSPLERKLYRVDWEGKKTLCLTPERGTHDITPCAGLRYFLDKHSALNTVPVFTLIDNNGRDIRVLEDNKALRETMDRYVLSPVTMLQVPNEKGDRLNAWMIKPANFDPARKYPLLMYQYSGPGSQEVEDKFPVGNYFWHQMMAQKGYIILCVDGTGTGARGEQFKKKTYLQLGKYESDDQIAVAKYMAGQNYIDRDRIGIWGWSYGGFMSATCILKGADVFKAAVAVAPVTNWRYYDNIYTERYMRTPQQNKDGYDQNAPESMASKLKGRFLIIHGTADDNVHFQNAAMLTEELIQANKQFESTYYPNKNHGIYGGNTRLQLFNRMTEFILKNL
ncbi:S9 family peptidase [Taibaiella chishuiensis]|uniref:Dipeptidyl-peptidase-4 n=1 Tax=Taibaiella chishuiensis TaxID=1434707 RepID=A0A2P8CVR5_9BACT|nr:S9 family peptidase [Taibaiella chishuiensis]PSK89029.1 dipeptidyl-peptidase-4 [Taibaiella chishuiensis]